MTGAVIAAVLFPIVGCIAGRRSLDEAFLFGLGIIGAAMFVLGLLHVPFVITIGLLVVAGLLGCWRNWTPSNPATQQPSNLAKIAMVVPLIAIAVPAAIVPLNDFDGRGFWLLKAKALANERTINGPFFHNEVMEDPRNQYPLLLPLDAAAVMMLAGDDDDEQVRFIYVLTFAALVFFVARRIDPWCGAILAWTPQFLVSNEGGVLTAYADIAFAAFVACAFVELIEKRSPLNFGLWLSFLILTKNEGLPIAIALALIGLRRPRAAAAPLLAAIALFVWQAGIPKTDEEDFLRLLPTLPSRLGRLFPAVIESGKHFFAIPSWGLLWMATLIALVVLALRKEWRAPAVLLAMTAVYLAAYTVTNWAPLQLINASADRLLMHMIGPALFAIARSIDVFAQNRYVPLPHPLRSA
ncbi:MAG TPA: hypothetical protein VER58_08715 [Thermoanaerobaculia bacterium]|nr:hypothetical protein [Thermoanaerobaculia bacterium]